MRFYRCKCGKRTAYGSDSPRSCQGCPDCNTTLTTAPEYHREPEPHRWEKRYSETTGQRLLDVCSQCFARDAVLSRTDCRAVRLKVGDRVANAVEPKMMRGVVVETLGGHVRVKFDSPTMGEDVIFRQSAEFTLLPSGATVPEQEHE